MEDFSTRIYGTSVLDNRPLFGETSAKVRVDRDSKPRCVCLSVCLPASLPVCPLSQSPDWVLLWSLKLL